MKFLLTVVLWFPGAPVPAVDEVIVLNTYEECELTRLGWEEATIEVVHSEYPNVKKEEVLFSYCSRNVEVEASSFESML